MKKDSQDEEKKSKKRKNKQQKLTIREKIDELLDKYNE